jgi:hypothetical protein
MVQDIRTTSPVIFPLFISVIRSIFIIFYLFLLISLSPVQSKRMVIFKDLEYKDLGRLNPGKWLNDSLVFCGMKCVLLPMV